MTSKYKNESSKFILDKNMLLLHNQPVILQKRRRAILCLRETDSRALRVAGLTAFPWPKSVFARRTTGFVSLMKKMHGEMLGDFSTQFQQ
jgi:hypothetical protein